MDTLYRYIFDIINSVPGLPIVDCDEFIYLFKCEILQKNSKKLAEKNTAHGEKRAYFHFQSDR